jgi:hypothetical protein
MMVSIERVNCELPMNLKYLQSNFALQWLLAHSVGAIAIATIGQTCTSFTISLFDVDNFILMGGLGLLFYLLGSLAQGYLQWRILTQVVPRLSHRWIYTPIVSIPWQIVTWVLLHFGMRWGVWDENGTILFILSIVGAIGYAIGGIATGIWQGTLLKQQINWRSIWHYWEQEHLLAGALGGVLATAIVVGFLLLFGWQHVRSGLYICLLFIALFTVSQFMYGLIVGDALNDAFKRSQLLR